MKTKAYQFADDTMRRMFIQRQLVLYLGSAFSAEWVEATLKELLSRQVAELQELGLEQPMTQALLVRLAAWNERFYGLNFTYTDHEAGPEWHLTFVDEMDSDPDVIAMRALRSAGEKN